MAEFTSDTLEQIGEIAPLHSDGVACVTVCHNEALILPFFLQHYRDIGVAHFYIVDDHSDDNTRDILANAPDVSVFKPINGAKFRENVGRWREQILDHFCANSWVTLPDLDEFLYFKDMPKPLNHVAAKLEADGHEALISAMVDMYADEPFGQHFFDGKSPPQDVFPFFDDQVSPHSGIRIMAQPKRFVAQFPTPPITLMGGLRERLFFQERTFTSLQAWLLARFAHIRRPLNPSFLEALENKLTRQFTKGRSAKTPSVLNKFALLKWPRGAKFSRAPHSIDKRISISEGLAASLHFKFYKGSGGLKYSAERAQHAGGSALAKLILEEKDILAKSPVFEGSRRFEGIASLNRILR